MTKKNEENEGMVTISIPEKYYEKISYDADKCLRTVEKQLEFMLREYYFDDEVRPAVMDGDIKPCDILSAVLKALGPEEKKY